METATPEAVVDMLKNVYDPEIGINVVDLGLVYDVDIDNQVVNVKMTLTTPGCPLHDTLSRTAEMAIETLDGVSEAHVDMIWDPPWTPERITDEGRRLLGI